MGSPGRYSNTLTATANTLTTTFSATGTAGAVDHFLVESAGGGAIPARVAGTPFSIQITALDANGNTATSFAGNAVLTSTGNLTGAPTRTTAAFVNGVLAAQAGTNTNTGTFAITATNSGHVGTSAAFSVAAGAVTHFAVTAIGGGAIPSQTAGTPFNVQLVALDANGNTATSFAGIAVITSTGTLTGAPLTTATFVNGVLASQAVTIANAGNFTLTATNTSPAAAGTSATFTVAAGAATHFAITAAGGGAIPAETAGTPFNVQLTALDANGNTATSFASTAVLTSTGALTGAPLATAAFTSGVLASQAVTLTNSGSFTLTVTAGTATGSSAAFTVGAGAVTHFAVTAVGGGAIPAQTAGTPFNVQIVALDANNNTASFSSATPRSLRRPAHLDRKPSLLSGVRRMAFSHHNRVTITNTGTASTAASPPRLAGRSGRASRSPLAAAR